VKKKDCDMLTSAKCELDTFQQKLSSNQIIRKRATLINNNEIITNGS